MLGPRKSDAHRVDTSWEARQLDAHRVDASWVARQL